MSEVIKEIKETITYHSQPDIIFNEFYESEVDIVKGKSLTVKEVDKNFNTLEGRSIKNFNLSTDGKSLNIELLNGKIFKIENIFNECISNIECKYDETKGELYIITNNDTDNMITLSGFLTKDTVKGMIKQQQIYTDNSIEGNGKPSSPLKVSTMQQTGMFKPVISIIKELPENPKPGDRYAITTSINKNGSLYNLNGVHNISKNIENTKWKVATKEDWDDMLNALESNEIDKTHNSKVCNEFLGKTAGSFLINDEFGFNTSLCGYANEENEDNHVIWEGKRSMYWTNTCSPNGKTAFTKQLDITETGVLQDISNGKNFYSVRLIRDIDETNSLTSEEIMGVTYSVVNMPSEKYGLRSWINVNFNSPLMDIYEETTTTETKKCDGRIITTTITKPEIVENANDEINRFVPKEWIENTEYITYICEWNGHRWLKEPIPNYYSFYLIEKQNYYYIENGQAYPMLDIDYLKEVINNLQLNLNTDITEGILEATINHLKNNYESISGLFTISTIDNLINYDINIVNNNYNPMFLDINNFLISLHDGGKINNLTYNDIIYYWDDNLNLNNKFTSEIGSTDNDKLLIQTLINEFNDNENNFINILTTIGLKLIINNIEFIIKLNILNN